MQDAKISLASFIFGEIGNILLRRNLRKSLVKLLNDEKNNDKT